MYHAKQLPQGIPRPLPVSLDPTNRNPLSHAAAHGYRVNAHGLANRCPVPEAVLPVARIYGTIRTREDTEIIPSYWGFAGMARPLGYPGVLAGPCPVASVVAES